MEIKTFSPKSHKIKALIYGASWSWKTSFGWTAENVLFASSENGLLSIADKAPAFMEINSLQNLIELRDFLQKWEHKFETLVIDSITEISDIIKADIEKRTWKGMQIQDWGELGREVEKIIKDIKEIDINVIVIAQEMTEKDSDKIAKIVPSLYWKSATKIAYYMDIVWYIFIDKEWIRHMMTSPNERLLTKDRTGKIWNDTEPDFEVWKKLVNEMAIWEWKVLYKTMTQDEIIKEEQKNNYNSYKKALELCSTMDSLKKVFLDISKNKTKISAEQYKNLAWIKDDVKLKIESKENKKKEKKIKKLEEDIKHEEEDYQNSVENPTNTEQFRKWLAKQKEKILRMKNDLKKLQVEDNK